MEGRPLRIGGMVTNFRHATSKAGNAYGVFTLEDYVGAFEFALFGNNYMEFQKYMIKDMYLYISAIVQERGSDYKYKKAPDPDKPREIELKIQKIEIFREIKDKLVETLTVTIPLQQIDTDFVIEFSEMVLKNKGTVNLYINIVDENSPNKVKLFSRQNRLKINPEVYHKLKNAKEEGKIVFQVN